MDPREGILLPAAWGCFRSAAAFSAMVPPPSTAACFLESAGFTVLLDLGSGAQSLFAEAFKPGLAGAACGGASEPWVPAPAWAAALCRESYLRGFVFFGDPRQTFSLLFSSIVTSLPGDAGGV